MTRLLFIIPFFVLLTMSSGCTTVPEKQEAEKIKLLGNGEPIKWVSVGTLVSVGPATESTRSPGRLESAIIGETKFSRTRVETTQGVYTVSEKIGLVETGVPVSVGYEATDEYPDKPSYLAFGGEQYEIVR